MCRSDISKSGSIGLCKSGSARPLQEGSDGSQQEWVDRISAGMDQPDLSKSGSIGPLQELVRRISAGMDWSDLYTGLVRK